MRVCLCVCERKRVKERGRRDGGVCGCVREREKWKERASEREAGKRGGREGGYCTLLFFFSLFIVFFLLLFFFFVHPNLSVFVVVHHDCCFPFITHRLYADPVETAGKETA